MVSPTPLGANNPFKYAAKLYRENGFAGTIPVGEVAGLKHPPPTGFTGGNAPYPTDSQVAKWLKTRADRNIALRLWEVDTGTRELPIVYAGNNVDGWELIGIDVDNYGEKHGWADLVELEAEYGALPATALSSARFAGWLDNRSAIRVFLVPKGYRYMGKAAPGIDVIQKRHRFMVVYPSRNPDAADALYEWRWGATNSDDTVGEYALQGFEGEIPDVGNDSDVAVLPEEWFKYLSHNGMGESEDPISELTLGGLQDWMVKRQCWQSAEATAADAAECDEADACRRMRDAVGNAIAELEASPSSHDQLQKHDWILLSLGAEGHHGLRWALSELHTAWYKSAIDRRGDAPETLNAEIGRSVYGALGKIQPKWQDYEPDDTCVVGDAETTDKWAEKFFDSEDAAALAEGDFGGLGPVVGRMHTLSTAKPADDYGMHDWGNGEHFVDLYGANVRYIGARKSWILWDGPENPDDGYGRWYRDNEERLMRSAFTRVRMRQEVHARELLGSAARDPEDKAAATRAKSWLSWAKRSGDIGQMKAALEAARSMYVGDEPVVLSANELDGNPVLLGCANGVIDLSSDDVGIRRPRKEDYITYNTNTDYVPWRQLAMGEDEDHVTAYLIWNDYMKKFLPNEELRLFVRKVLGHLLIGENPEKKIVFLFGRPDTGKSTLIGAISGAVGDYYGTIDMNLFKHKDLNPGLARAIPLRITGMSEMEDTSKSGVIDAAVVKRLTGNDMVTVELKYSNDILDARPQFTTIIACNNPPTINNADAALYERLLVLPLDNPVKKTERKYDAQQRITKECGVAVLSWLIEGWKDYQREGLSRESWPQVVLDANIAFASQLNSTQEYIAEYLELAKDTEEGRTMLNKARARAKKRGKDEATASDLDVEWTPIAERVYLHYKHIVTKMGGEPIVMQQFTRDLGVGRTVVRKIDGVAKSVYMGVKFKAEPEEVRMSARLKT